MKPIKYFTQAETLWKQEFLCALRSAVGSQCLTFREYATSHQKQNSLCVAGTYTAWKPNNSRGDACSFNLTVMKCSNLYEVRRGGPTPTKVFIFINKDVKREIPAVTC